MGTHWVIVAEWCVDYQGGLEVVGVYHDPVMAKEEFRKRVDSDDRTQAEENNYEILEDTDTVFDSGKEGYYSNDHIAVYLKEVSETGGKKDD